MKAIRDSGGEATAFQSPLANLTDGESLVREIVVQVGSLDTLINNAAVSLESPSKN